MVHHTVRQLRDKIEDPLEWNLNLWYVNIEARDNQIIVHVIIAVSVTSTTQRYQMK